LVDDGTGAAVSVPENNQISEADLTFAQATLLSAGKWAAPMVRVSRELAIEDSKFDLATHLAQAFGTRFARGIGAQMVTDIIAASSQGVQLATGNATTVTFDGLVDLMSSVDPSYLSSPKAAFAMRFATLAALFKLKAASGGQAMLPLTYDGRFRLFGFPVLLAPSVPAIAASAKTILFGDFGRWAVRTVRDSVQVRVYLERYAEFGQVGYNSQLRMSGNMIKATGADSPIKYLQQSAT
jgi:HK97 family phage major capsid protein